MKHEKSCGAIIWTDVNGQRLYLVEQMRKGHYDFAKGHMEPGETEEQTALREILEETGLSVTLNTAFREEITYSPFPGCIKDVVFFTAYSPTRKTHPQPEEVQWIGWLSFEEALAKLTKDNSREILRKAEQFLNIL